MNSILLGKDVRIISRKNEIMRKAVDINEDGELVVEDRDGNREAVFSGGVSVRGIHGYVKK